MILSFLEFHKFVDKSRSGGTSHITTIWDDPISAKSHSAGFLLKKDLEQEEFQEMIQRINAPDWVIKGLIKNPNTPRAKRMLQYQVTLNNLQFLKDMKKENGELRCEYCNKGPLVIYDINPNEITQEMIEDPNYRYNQKFNTKDGATCDHKIPQSRGGDKFNYDNLAVSCYQCSQRKGNRSYEDWMDIIKQKS